MVIWFGGRLIGVRLDHNPAHKEETLREAQPLRVRQPAMNGAKITVARGAGLKMATAVPLLLRGGLQQCDAIYPGRRRFRQTDLEETKRKEGRQ